MTERAAAPKMDAAGVHSRGKGDTGERPPQPNPGAASRGSHSRPPPNLPLGGSLRPRGPVEFRVAHHERPEAAVVTVAGELDILTAPKFGASIDELVRRVAGEIVVDLSEVRFVDSAGLQILLNAQRRVTRRGRRLTVICPPGAVRDVIELARLSEVLGVLSSFAEYESGGPGAAA